MTAICEVCWAPFPDEDELAKHVEMEQAVDWPIPAEDDPSGN